MKLYNCGRWANPYHSAIPYYTRSSVEIMELVVKLNRESGITIILVTHEPDIAAFSRRIIKFRDGLVVSDEPVKQA